MNSATQSWSFSRASIFSQPDTNESTGNADTDAGNCKSGKVKKKKNPAPVLESSICKAAREELNKLFADASWKDLLPAPPPQASTFIPSFAHSLIR